MERLTQEDWKRKSQGGIPWSVHPVYHIDDLPYYKRLAAYEDTGFTPEQVVEMAKELERWHTDKINKNIKNEFANKSTLICHNCDHKDEYIEELEQELAEYKKLEEQRLLLKLPCKVGDTVYCIHDRYTKCSAYNGKFEEYNCQGCESECDSKKEYYIAETTADAFFCALSMLEGKFGQSIFLTQEEAEAKLKEMEK